MIIQLFFLTVTISRREFTEADYKREQLYKACREQQESIQTNYLQQSRSI